MCLGVMISVFNALIYLNVAVSSPTVHTLRPVDVSAVYALGIQHSHR